MSQYYKLFKKVKMGADFLITQVGFDVRKFDEVYRFMRHTHSPRSHPRKYLYPQSTRGESDEPRRSPWVCGHG